MRAVKRLEAGGGLTRGRAEGWRYDPRDGRYVASVHIGTSGQARIRIEVDL